MKQYKTIEDYKKDEELQIENIVKEYSGYIYTVVKNFVHDKFNDEDIEEIISDAFFILWKNQQKLHNEDKINFYLAGIAKNLIKEKIRKQKSDFPLKDLESFIPSNIDLYENYEETAKIDIIQKSLNNLSDIDRLIFQLFYYENKKSKEIAQKLKMNEITVRSRLHRIKKYLKKELELGGYSYE